MRNPSLHSPDKTSSSRKLELKSQRRRSVRGQEPSSCVPKLFVSMNMNVARRNAKLMTPTPIRRVDVSRGSEPN